MDAHIGLDKTEAGVYHEADTLVQILQELLPAQNE